MFCLCIYLQAYQRELFLSLKHVLSKHSLTRADFGISMEKAET